MSQNHNDFSEHSTYSERVTERFVGKDVSATPATVRVLQAVAIVGTILTYLDTYLLTDRRGWISILLGAFLCFFYLQVCRARFGRPQRYRAHDWLYLRDILCHRWWLGVGAGAV